MRQETWPKELTVFSDGEQIQSIVPGAVENPAKYGWQVARYLPAQSIAPLVGALEEISEDICGWSGRSVECVDNPARPASDWCLRCIAAQALSDFKAHTQPEVLRRLIDGGEVCGVGLEGFDAIHASPPCQASSSLRHLHPDVIHPELIPPTRELLRATGLPYVIENVPGADLIEPIILCGSMFGNGANGRQLRRHRLFETNFRDTFLKVPTCQHNGQALGVYGYGGGGDMTRGYKGTAAEYREAMEMPWATKAEIAQAIPPAYTRFIGEQLLTVLTNQQREASAA